MMTPDLLAKYDQPVPRYTSYPTAPHFHAGIDAAAYGSWLEGLDPALPLSLYFHIPFCNTVCYYCACNKVVTKDRARAAAYLARLHREIALQGALFDAGRPVDQLHWGGGTPTFISHDEMRELMSVTRRHFNLRDDDGGEYSIEIDPREADAATVAVLRELGFNRMSLGVQDFEPKVQKAVNRVQSEAETLAVMDAARTEGFNSISVDLIYGLPFQDPSSFARTLDTVVAAAPDRISVFNYAHLPERFKPQRRIAAADLPPAEQKLAILAQTIAQLNAAGYVYIGMDHFAKPQDELARAQREGTLYRNFQGYSTHAECDLVGLGVTAIGNVGEAYAQNVRTLDEYYARLDAGRLAVFRGVELNADDRLRSAVINDLICHFSLDIPAIETRFGLRFAEHFAPELGALRAMEADGLLRLEPERIQVLPAGQLLIRSICMVFDAYLRGQREARFSRVI